MPTPGLSPRAAAWRILHDLRHGVPFDRARVRAFAGLAEPDRALAQEIAAGVLRHRNTLDSALTPQLAGGTARVRDDLLDILRLGAYQLLFLDRIPAHAAVDTAVTLGRRFGGARMGGFVNAVLRKVAESGIGNRESGMGQGGSRPDSPFPTSDSLAAEFSHPAWLVSRWVSRFGPDETERLLRANNARPALVLQPARWTEAAIIASLDSAGIVWHHAPYRAGLVVAATRPGELPGFLAGAWYVQDPAQALVVRYAAVPEQQMVFDACAAPGGKSLALLSAARPAPPRLLLGADLRLTRVRRLGENLRRAAAAPWKVIVADAEHPPVRPCDVVLLDAPCLGTGVFGRHPDARWRVTATALSQLADQAARLLHASAEVVRPGGWLIFATCSLEPEENELQVDRFLTGDPRFRRDPPSVEVLPDMPELTPAGDLLLLPHRHGTDGAFAARLRRVAE